MDRLKASVAPKQGARVEPDSPCSRECNYTTRAILMCFDAPDSMKHFNEKQKSHIIKSPPAITHSSPRV